MCTIKRLSHYKLTARHKKIFKDIEAYLNTDFYYSHPTITSYINECLNYAGDMLDQYHITYKSLDEYFFPEGSCRNSHDYYMHECLLHETVIYEDHLKITGEEKVFNSKKYINIHARIDVEGWDDCISTDFLIRASTELLKKYNLTIEDINIINEMNVFNTLKGKIDPFLLSNLLEFIIDDLYDHHEETKAA